MIRTKYILTGLFVIIGFLKIFATPQISDKLVYNGNTFSVYLYLPNEFYKPDTVMFDSTEYINHILSVDLFGDRKACSTTACGREYQATWEIIGSQLYLTGIYSCCYYEDSIKADLTLLFREKVMDEKVKAAWISTKILIQSGKTIANIDDYLSIFENDSEFEFKEGNLSNIINYNNLESRKSIYSQNHEKLVDFIYSNINWDDLPTLQESIRVTVQFSANEDGKVDSAKVMRGDNKLFNKEAVRVIQLIPDWDVFYFKGSLFRQSWIMPIIFSEENRMKYKK